MKNLILSAVMMMAFVGNAMAKSSEVVAKKVNNVNEVKRDDKIATDCAALATNLLSLHNTRAGLERAITWLVIYLNCESTNK
ncbi:MAG: hypothetical protein RLZZ312_1511 [Bacteroidota bacterium]|jgi:hypothetical protein